MGCDQVFPEVPLVLDHLVAEGAGHALGLHVDIDNVLLEIERVREGFPAVIAYPGLHAAPSVAWQVWSLTQLHSVFFSQSRIGIKQCFVIQTYKEGISGF